MAIIILAALSDTVDAHGFDIPLNPTGRSPFVSTVGYDGSFRETPVSSKIMTGARES